MIEREQFPIGAGDGGQYDLRRGVGDGRDSTGDLSGRHSALSTPAPLDRGRVTPPRPKNTHIFAKAEGQHYVDPEWLSVRLFEVEHFPGLIWDPFAGWGRIADAARAVGYPVCATDIANRGYPRLDEIKDFFTVNHIDRDVSIVGNPPFDDEIVQHAIALNPIKLALVWPFARIVAAWPWLATAPLAHVYMLTPRPAMPPAHYLEAGKKPEGARVEHCWLVFERGYRELPTLGWLHRDRSVGSRGDVA